MNLNVPQFSGPGGGGGLRPPQGTNGSLAAPLPAGRASATGNPRNKTALKPGHSLMDWIRLGRNNDLAGTAGRVIPVPLDELAKHDKQDDAWTAIKGKVYNITPYMDFHPGGVDELMRSAGIDGTELFDEVHKWVNYDSMLAKCYIGPLVGDSPSSTKQKVKGRASTNSLTVSGLGNLAPPVGKPSPRYEWLQNDNTITLVMYTKCKSIRAEHIIIDKAEKNLRITAMVEDYVYSIALGLESEVESNIELKASRPSGKVEIVLKKITCQRWSNLGVPLPLNNKWTKATERDKSYRECEVLSVETVTHDTRLYCVQIPQGCIMRVPVGHHVYIKTDLNGMSICKPYTVVPNSLLRDRLDPAISEGRVLNLMIKIYNDGALTPIIDQVKPGDKLNISDHEGDFDLRKLEDCEHLVMCAAGTGFTPMAGLILQSLVLNLKTSRKVQMFFFNKETKDILWNEVLKKVLDTQEDKEIFEVIHILSQPDQTWTGLTGRIRSDILKYKIPSASDKALFCACGPTAFTNEAVRLAKEEFKYSENSIHAFLG